LPFVSTLIIFSTAGDWKVPSSGPKAACGQPMFWIVPRAIILRVPPYCGVTVVAVVAGGAVVVGAAVVVGFVVVVVAGAVVVVVGFGVDSLAQLKANMEASKPMTMAR